MKTNKLNFLAKLRILSFSVVVFLMTVAVTEAATPAPSCVLLVTTSAGIYAETGTSEALQVVGDPLKFFWLSSNASKVENKNGTSLPTFGVTTKNPKSKTTYTYTFFNGNKSIECEIIVHPVKGSIDEKSLTTISKEPTITGKATNLKEVKLEFYKVGTKNKVHESGAVKVSGGAWKYVVDKSLSDGQYDMVLKANEDWRLNTITTEVLSIGKISQENFSGTVVVQVIPLLSGGSAKAGNTVNLLYLQMLNVSNDPVTITGIKMEQNGTAAVGSVLSLMATDDTNKATGQVGSAGVSPFKSGVATIPITITLQPNETRLFTLKATLASNLSSHIGDTLKLEVTGVNSRSNIKGTFPIRGVTWTLSN